MAVVAQNAVTVLGSRRYSSQPVSLLVQAKITLSSQGAAANHIPASALGLGSLIMASVGVESDGSTLYEVGILPGTMRGNADSAYSEDVLVVGADDGYALEDVTGDFYVSVIGDPLS